MSKGTVRWSKADLDAHNARNDKFRAGIKQIVQERTLKYCNEPTYSNGTRFASKGEAALFDHLRLLQHAGEVLYFLRQVPIHLPGNVQYRVDFLVFWNDGRVRYLDFKGKLTPMFVLKQKQVQELYPIQIECITLKRGAFVEL